MESNAQPEPVVVAKPKRRWRKYCLWSFLVVVAALGITLGVIGWRVERQRRAVATIQEMGGDVIYDFQNRFPEIDPITGELDVQLPAPAWMMKRFGWDWFADVTVVSLSYSEMTDEQMPLLKAFPKLERFQIGTDQRLGDGPVQVTDASIDLLASFPKLRKVDLMGAAVTKEGVARLQQALPECEIRYNEYYVDSGDQ